MILRLLAGALALVLFSAAPARADHGCGDDRYLSTCDVRHWNGHGRFEEERRGRSHREKGSSIVAHPAGCPHVAFCGCGASIEVFGHSIRSLWLAANWFRFPRAEPAAGMAAVRQHHVMVIREYLGNGQAVVYDANSGHHLTRVHVRSLSGYRIVNPKAS